MRRIGRLLMVAFWVLVVAGGIALAVLDVPGEKSYYFPRVDIDARIRPNGTLALHERRTFDFTGDFSYAFFTIESTHAPRREHPELHDPGGRRGAVPRPKRERGRLRDDVVLRGS